MEITSNAKHSIVYKVKLVVYWLATGFIAFELILGALWDFNLVNKGFVSGFMHNLGYPLYFAHLMGAWKIPGAIVLLLPGLPTLKEWAYAGAFFIYTGAAASNAFVGDWNMAMVPFVIACIEMVSYFLRPDSRRFSVE